MTEIDIEAQRTQVENAAKRVYDLDQKVRQGDLSTAILRERGEAYKVFVSVRSEKVVKKKKGE